MYMVKDLKSLTNPSQTLQTSFTLHPDNLMSPNL
jgi:hypothetical protein